VWPVLGPRTCLNDHRRLVGVVFAACVKGAKQDVLRVDEKRAWEGFLAAEPKFAGENIAMAAAGPDPPDVLCTTESGKSVGVELTKWVEHDQLSSGKARERVKNGFLAILASEREPRPERVGWMWLYPRGRQVKPAEAVQFRQQFYSLLAQQNSLRDPDWDNPQGAPVNDFTGFPLVAKYLCRVWIHPRRRLQMAVERWVMFEDDGGAYTIEWMVQAALDRIYAKIEAYEDLDLHAKHELHELHLLCHYDDEALLYNTPTSAPGYNFAVLATKVAKPLANDHCVFDRIFLFNPYESQKVMRVFPA